MTEATLYAQIRYDRSYVICFVCVSIISLCAYVWCVCVCVLKSDRTNMKIIEFILHSQFIFSTIECEKQEKKKTSVQPLYTPDIRVIFVARVAGQRSPSICV